MKRMLINATQEEELRMAMVDGQLLYDLNIEAPASERKKANIYKGKITRIEPSLEAAFVDYGAERHGFLPLKEISSEYFVKQAKANGKTNIKDVLKEGQDIVVQVDKEERGNKGAALTTFVSLAGRFIVLKPNKDRSGGVSRRITGDDRDLARQALNEIEIPENMSVILRTAGIDRSAEELAWDLQNLLTVWTAILNVVLERSSPFLIYREGDSVVRALRDYLTNDIGEILIDDEATYKDAYAHVEQTMPHNLKKLKHYVDPVPLFTRFQIESQIESAFAHKVNLPSGGSIVIDHTEALVSIDINSARATKGGDIEATAFNTNLEAADEIARQLRIRDLGGLIVIDFIDMGPQKHQREVENRLRDAVRQDRARIQIGKISRFGLMEMSRQRLRPSIGESAYKTCPRCTGFGTIRGTESLALAILRIIGEEARKERTAKVIAQLPVEVATYLLNEKRDWVQNLEDRNETQVVLVANPHLETPHYDVRRVRDDQLDLPENAGASFKLAHTPIEPESPQAILARKGVEAAAVGTLKPSTPAPQRKEPEGKGLWATIVDFFSSSDDDEKKKPARKGRTAAKSTRGRRPAKPSQRRAEPRSGSDTRKKPRKAKKKKAASRNAKQGPKDSDAKPGKDQDKGQQQPKAAQDKNGAIDDAGNETKRTRSRRSRGGRRRRRSGEKTEQDSANTQQSAKTPDSSARSEEAPKPKPEQPRQAENKPSEKASAPESSGASNGGGSADKPASSRPRRAPRKPRADGPPKARTDAERASDAQKSDDGAPQKPAAAPAAPKPDSRTKPDVAPKPESHVKPDAAPKPEPKVQPAAAAKQETNVKPDTTPKPGGNGESRPEAKPADVSPPVEKPAAKLLPWDNQD
ncbi:MAG TPA: Rne/Rng family ribonuclease [Woeseiaceae bacterium]|nr:Rne/Rng family ribonuclease [Woeseiaceae bacterium]